MEICLISSGKTGTHNLNLIVRREAMGPPLNATVRREALPLLN